MNPVDTICAISTPPGRGGIAVARLSGPQAIAIADKIWTGRPLAQATSHTAHLGTVADSHGEPLDQAVATIYRAPASFTGDDTVELSVHGSRWIQRELIASLIAAGARLALPGEFSQRAFTAGKLDLAQTEAVADMIAAESRAAHRIALNQMKGSFSRRLDNLRRQLVDLTALLELELDFSEEDVEFASRHHLRQLAHQILDELQRLAQSFAAGNAIRNGIPVAIVGSPNAGKSSLLNALLDHDRAIVSDIPGTTRDTIEDTLELGEYLFRFIDTAGLRNSTDTIEQLGIERSMQAIAAASIVIITIDASQPLAPQAPSWLKAIPDSATRIIALNKADLPAAVTPDQAAALGPHTQITLSALSRQGIDTLRQALCHAAEQMHAGYDETVTNLRHAQALTAAASAAERVIQGLDANLSGDLIAQDLRQTIHHISQITGQITTTEILQTIFSRFCIGK